MGEYAGKHYKGYWRDTRSLDYSSCDFGDEPQHILFSAEPELG